MREMSALKSVANAVKILDAFGPENPELGVSQLSRMLGLGKSTVHRLLVTLEAAGLVRQSETSRRYSLGFKVLEFASTLTSGLDVRTVALPHMRKLRDETNETVALHLLQGHSRVCVTQVESFHELRRSYTDIGRPLPLVAGSPGKAMAAFLPDAEQEELLTGLEGEERERLRSELKETRRRGYALSRGERTPGISSVSAPIFDAGSRVVAAINISGPSFRFPPPMEKDYGLLLLGATRQISRELGAPEERQNKRKGLTNED